MSISDLLRGRASEEPARVLLPEGDNPRVREAAAKAAALGVCRPLLVTVPGEAGFPASGVETLDISSAQLKAEAAAAWAAAKKLPQAEAEARCSSGLGLAAGLLAAGRADGMVAGAAHATADVLRPALELRKLYIGIPPVVSCFLFEIPGGSFGDGGLMVFADCGMNPDPAAPMLAQIGGAAGKAAKTILGLEPRVALLSFSTKGSAEHQSVLKVRQALEIARQKFPDLAIDGELQADAALVPWVGEKKAPGSPVAGRANVLVFPDLNSGNIAYKLVERLAGARAIGPVVLGLNPPVNDLSRGCSVDDMIDMCAVTSIQAAAAGEAR